jgi:putative RecB family exonuclease
MRDYSFSRLNLYESCPAAFRMKYIDKLPESPSEALLTGGLIHRIIAEYTKHCLECGVQTDVTEMSNIVQRCFYDQPAGLESSKYPEILKLAQYFADTHQANIDQLIGYEEWIQAKLAGGKYIFRGIIDRLDIEGSAALITDFKTDYQIRSWADVEHDFQLAVYAWLVSKEYPQVEQFEVQLDFVRFNVQRAAVYERGEVEKIEGQVLALIGQVEQAIAKKAFPPRPGHFCGWCGYSGKCLAAKNIPADMQPITSVEDAQKAAEELAILERQVAVRKEALKDYCSQAGPVEANGLTWGFHRVGGLGIENVEGFVQIINEHGLDPRPYLSVNGTKIKKLWEKNGLGEKLKAIAVDKSTTRFEGKKSKVG